jgi:hypothetical protein
VYCSVESEDTYKNVPVVEGIADVHEHLLASVGVLDGSFKTTVLLFGRLPTSWVAVIGLTAHGFE